MGILQGKARGGEEESVLMHDLKPFRILISLLDKPELGKAKIAPLYVFKCTLTLFVIRPPATQGHCFHHLHVCVFPRRSCDPGGRPHRGVPNFAHAVSNRVGPSKPESF